MQKYSLFILFQACERAESSKSCNPIGSESERHFTFLPANLGGSLTASFTYLFVPCEWAKPVIFKPYLFQNLGYY